MPTARLPDLFPAWVPVGATVVVVVLHHLPAVQVAVTSRPENGDSFLSVSALRDDQKALLEHDSGGNDQSGKEYHCHTTEPAHGA